MKFLVVVDSFKESISSKDIGKEIKKGILVTNHDAKVESISVSDGGEGFIESFEHLEGTKKIQTPTLDPLNRPINAEWLYQQSTHTAFIESANCIGLHLVSIDERNPKTTSTRGLGILIKEAIKQGAKRIFIGLGGSSTNDGGLGMISELGGNFLNQDNRQIKSSNIGLKELDRIEIHNVKSLLDGVEIVGACDVDNPLTGLQGATYTYAEQKGGTKNGLEEMETNMLHFQDIIDRTFNTDSNSIKGGGAAGGLGLAINLFMDGRLVPGFEIINAVNNLETAINAADIIITGEGKYDFQSKHGKVAEMVMEMGLKLNKEVVGVVGICDAVKSPFHHLFQVMDKANSKADSMENAGQYLYEIGKDIGQLYLNK